MNVGTMALEDGARVDFSRLRSERRSRVLAAMETDDLDAVLLGRPGNVRFVGGARQLWTAGIRPFAPACAVTRATGEVHLLSVWDEGIPPEIERSQLFGITWNPSLLAESIRAVPGLLDARRIGTDSLGPMFASLLRAALPGATFVDASVALTRARATKTAAELACITTAAAVAEAALAEMAAELRPGLSEKQLVARYHAVIAGLGSPTPPSEAVAFAIPRVGPPAYRQVATERPVGPRELVVLSPGAFYAGYEAALARTFLVAGRPSRGQQRLAADARQGLDALVAACRPGATGAELRRAWESTGLARPPVPWAHGLGLGAEPPVIGLGRGDRVILAPGTVLAVQAWVAAAGAGGVLERDTIHVTEDGPRTITRYARTGS